ncbi:MAG: sigma-70 family RNA polymerase sigma factor [bacterium]|nr:sigma-70 family RNA polymerase sigma factor [bacterium]
MVQNNDAFVSDEDAALIEGYVDGRGDAFRRVGEWILSDLRRHYPRLAGEHEDLCQNAHQRLLGGLRAGRFEGRASLRTYVSRIAHRTAITRLRTLYRDRAISESVEEGNEPRTDDNPYRTVASHERASLAHQVVMALPEECRRLWKLVFLDELPYETVAETLGVPPGTVKSRMWHCRRKAASALRRLRLLERRG